MSLSYCVILAAGQGSRAAPLSGWIPKPLFPVADEVAIGVAIRRAKQLHLEPLLVTGHEGEKVQGYVNAAHPGTRTVHVPGASTNLFESLVAAAKRIPGEGFLWCGAAVFFERNAQLRRLLAVHRRTGAFCTMFRQRATQYAPKLVTRGGNLVQFVLGQHDSPWSAPTIFAVSADFAAYAETYAERDVFQAAIDTGKMFEVLTLSGWSRQIHSMEDYVAVVRHLNPVGFISRDSTIQRSLIEASHVFRSSVRDCKIRNSIIIDARVDGQDLADVLVAGRDIRVAI